jgi:MFS family permease
MVLWGLILTLMGIVTNYSQLLALRALLGIFEAGLFPGVNYYLSCWYKRTEFGIRAAIFFSAAAVSPFLYHLTLPAFRELRWLLSRGTSHST